MDERELRVDRERIDKRMEDRWNAMLSSKENLDTANGYWVQLRVGVPTMSVLGRETLGRLIARSDENVAAFEKSYADAVRVGMNDDPREKNAEVRFRVDIGHDGKAPAVVAFFNMSAMDEVRGWIGVERDVSCMLDGKPATMKEYNGWAGVTPVEDSTDGE